MSSPSLTAPLNLRQFLRAPTVGLDLVPVLDLLTIGLFFALLNSQFLFPPGLNIALPQGEPSELSGTPVAAVVTVLPRGDVSARGEGLVLFRGEILRISQLQSALSDFLKKSPVEAPVLLVKLDRQARIEQLAEISEVARATGFQAVQIAAEGSFGSERSFSSSDD